VWGQWYLCPPGAIALPFLHPYLAREWDRSNFRPPTRLGEFPGRDHRNLRPPNPRYTGQQWIGDVRFWQQGGTLENAGRLAVDNEGVPLLALAKARVPHGTGIGGKGRYGNRRVHGGGIGGNGKVIQLGSGGAVVGGTGRFVALGSGGIQTGGHGWFLEEGAGGSGLGGKGQFIEIGSGGIQGGGTGRFLEVGSGGVLIGGTGRFLERGSGGMLIGGTGRFLERGSGGMLLGGTGRFLAVGSGGTLIGGKGAWISGEHNRSLLGGMLIGGAGIWVDDVAITGQIIEYGSATPPTGFLPCDGAAVSRATYATLFALIGVTYGGGNGSTTFNVPDHRGRVGIGAGTGAGLTNRVGATTGGEESHQLTTLEIPSHNHAGAGAANFLMGGGASFAMAGGSGGSFVANTANTGGGTGHNTMPPYLVSWFYIKT
jgi:microcystin-dependent protein